MTELEQARLWLRIVQGVLQRERAVYAHYGAHGTAPLVRAAECAVLAALSWVWDAQERAPRIEPTAVWRVKGVGEKGELLLSIG